MCCVASATAMTTVDELACSWRAGERAARGEGEAGWERAGSKLPGVRCAATGCGELYVYWCAARKGRERRGGDGKGRGDGDGSARVVVAPVASVTWSVKNQEPPVVGVPVTAPVVVSESPGPNEPSLSFHVYGAMPLAAVKV